LECGGNAAALALFATDSWKGTSARATGSAESQSAAVGGALQMAPANIQNDPLPIPWIPFSYISNSTT